MNYLLDTHTFLWAITDEGKLSALARKTIENTANEVMVSAVSFWEISLKYSLGKLDISGFMPEDLPGLAAESGFSLIPLLPSEASSYHQLPAIGDHRDPFDKMLMRQALKLDLTLISKDRSMTPYRSIGLKLLW